CMKKAFYSSPLRATGGLIAAMCVPFLLIGKDLDHLHAGNAAFAVSHFPVLDDLRDEQAVIITGKIVSANDGEGIPCVSILLKGTTIGTVTDINGDFQLEAGTGTGTLVVSSIDCATQEIAINGRTVINVTLAEVIQGLDE